MVPLLFLVATTTTSNSTGNGNYTQGKNNNKSNAPRHVRPNTEQFEIATKSHRYPLQSSLFLKIGLFCISVSACICLIIAFSTALLLPDHNELQQPWTVLYGLLCVCINTANGWLCGCDSWLSLQS